jgi:hypothetical protein
MSENQLNATDIEVILDALRHAKMKYEQTEYPDPEFRRKQLERAKNAEKKLRALQAEMVGE